MRSTFAVLLVLACLSFSLTAQVNSAENEFCHEDYAKFLVSQQVSESNSLTDAPKRIKILIRSADFIWPYDQVTGRTYFTNAFNAAKAHFRESGYQNRKIGEDARSVTAQLPDQRFEVIRAIAKRDAAWARKLTDEVLKDLEASAKEAKDSDRSREISALLGLAGESISTNPDLSWYLFRRVMRYPLGHEWYFTLYTIAGKDQQISDALYQELIRNYRNESTRQLLFLSAYPFARARIFGPEGMSFGVTLPESLLPNPTLQRMFLETYFARIAASVSGSARTADTSPTYFAPEPVSIYIALQQLEPIISESIPEMLQRLALAKAQASSLLTDDLRRDIGVREGRLAGNVLSFDERIEQLEEAFEKGTLTDSMIIFLITMVDLKEDQFAKIESWLDKIKEEKVRIEAGNYFWFRRANLATEELRFRDAERYAEKVPEADHRAILMFGIVEKQLENESEAVTVTQTLSNVSKFTSTLGNTLSRARVRLGLANKFSSVNPTFAINELSDAVSVMNQLKDPDLTSTTVYRQIIGKTFSHYTAYYVPSYSLETTFKEVSKNEISLPLSNAKAIDDRYLRAIAVLAVASNCIDRPKPKTNDTSGY